MLPLSAFIGLRYTRAKKRNHFISFISIVSVLGIALGITVLITVLSVMNGFDHEIRSRILSMVPQATVTEWGQKLYDWQGLQKRLKSNPKIVAMAPFIQGQAMITAAGGSPVFAMVEGVEPHLEQQVSPIGHKLIAGDFQQLKPRHYGIVLGVGLAENLGVTVGDKVTLYVAKTTLTPLGTMPRIKRFTVTGIFKVGYQFDSSYALINLQDASTLFMMKHAVSGLQLKLTNLFLAPALVHQLNQTLPATYQSYDWTAQNPNFFKALKMEKLMMFLMLALIVAVAAFNMLSSLVMVVTDKQADIAILRTVGASSKMIMAIFVWQGSIVGLFGTIMGIIGGVILSWNVTALVNWLQNLLHVQFLNSNVYYISFVPSLLKWDDVWHVALVAMIMCLLATLYPAWRASRIQPAEALRYE